PETVHETEVYGITYDRITTSRHQVRTVKNYGIKTVLESPSMGAKAAGSLYSLGFGAAGCDITLVNPEPAPLEEWKTLGWQDRVTSVQAEDYAQLPFEDNSFDMAWNFATFANMPDPVAWTREMTRVSKDYVMVVSCNNCQAGYPWHRFLHRINNIPWTHGDTYFNFIWNVKKMFRDCGMDIVEFGAFDSPPWPDPVGFRDIRLHKIGTPEQPKEISWTVPFVEMWKKQEFPLWMRALNLYDVNLRKGYLKLPISHLFYVIGKKRK
ncbi:MAG: methyltransferase domain-containing protein, partial [Puniceicoccales bacterium]